MKKLSSNFQTTELQSEVREQMLLFSLSWHWARAMRNLLEQALLLISFRPLLKRLKMLITGFINSNTIKSRAELLPKTELLGSVTLLLKYSN